MRRLCNGRVALSVLLVSVSTFAGCAIPLKPPPQISYNDEAQPAVQLADLPKPVEVVETPKLLPLPGQLKPLHAMRPRLESGDPRKRVEKANAAARIQPSRDGYINAVQVYPFAPGALYQVYAAPGQVTDVALQESEQLVGSGPVAAGDTVRWIIGDTESGTGLTKRVHILVKPTRPDLVSNLVINTDRRTYLLELRSAEKTYMASVSWQYPGGSTDRAAPPECERGGRDADRERRGYFTTAFPLRDRG
jgi:type IV secretion system protein TrbG